MMTTLDDALAAVLAQAQPLETVQVDLFHADGRVLRADCVSALQVPPQDNSAMDGYAMRAADIPAAGTVLPVSQRIPAGHVGTPLEPGTVARIFTGAPVPQGADAVLMQEVTDVQADGRVQFNAVPNVGQNIRRAGEDIALNSKVLAAGTRLTPAAIGLAASIGMAQLTVARKPRVALFSTGDELVLPGTVAPQDMPPGHIYNSNRYFLSALLERLGCEVVDGGILPDNREQTVAAIQRGAQDCDLVLSSAGVSVGEEDHVKPAVEQQGELNLWMIAMKPGKPFAYGKVFRNGKDASQGAAHFMGLPGNPVSSLITFLVLVRPFLLRLQGMQAVAPRAISVTAQFDWPKKEMRREFLRARYNTQGELELFGNQGSGVLTSTVWGDGLIDNPPLTPIAKGDSVRFIPFTELM